MPEFLNSKKGVSPLIATVLLVAFAVALGSVVMNWGLNLNLGKPDKCRSVDLKIREVGASDVCFGGFGRSGYINFVLDNTGIDVNGLTILIIGDKGTRFFDMNNAIIKKDSLFDKKDKEVSYDFSVYGNIKQVQFIPKVKGTELQVCSKNAVTADKIGVCS